jgi:SpoVK/Ycf46/Vps4 family AAA+-type ATPase
MSNKVYIADRFRRIVALHIVKNVVQKTPVRVPLILGIHGPSGYGKTYQCEQILHEMGITAFLISGGQLESGTAGEPARLVREKYIAASQSIQNKESRAAVVLINDVDTGLGNWGEKVQTTINTQTVYGELMHLVDYPTCVEGLSTKRIPIILTGNDFTKLYEPLVRAGRMTAFAWNPNLQEKTAIISGIFPELNDTQCQALAGEFSDQPVAFFSHLRSTLTDDILWRSIQEIGVSKVINYIGNGHEPEMYIPIRYDYLIKAGKEFLHSGQLINHLRR